MLHDLAHLGQVDLVLLYMDIQPHLQCIELQFLVPWNLSFLLKKSLQAEIVKKVLKIEQTPSRFGQNRAKKGPKKSSFFRFFDDNSF